MCVDEYGAVYIHRQWCKGIIGYSHAMRICGLCIYSGIRVTISRVTHMFSGRAAQAKDNERILLR